MFRRQKLPLDAYTAKWVDGKTEIAQFGPDKYIQILEKADKTTPNIEGTIGWLRRSIHTPFIIEKLREQGHLDEIEGRLFTTDEHYREASADPEVQQRLEAAMGEYQTLIDNARTNVHGNL